MRDASFIRAARVRVRGGHAAGAAVALGGCAGGGGAANSYAMASRVAGITGRPWPSNRSTVRRPQVFDRMVGVLDSESKLRNLSVVSREGRLPIACAVISPPRSCAAGP